MGVDIGGAHWTYSGFMRFREKLAEMEGIVLGDMAGYGGIYSPNGRQIPWDTVQSPIVPLLNHSDCDGELSPEECAQVYPQLAELVEQLEDSYDRDNGRLLVAAMKAAVEHGEPLEFW